MTEQCVVCCDARLTRTKTVECGACEFKCCTKCIKRFILDLNDDPQCMSCRRRMTHTDLLKVLPRTFVNKDLKRHREAVLLDRQKAMIPATQDDVVMERNKRLSRKRIRDWETAKDQLRRQIHALNRAIFEEQHALARTGPVERRQFLMPCSREGCRGFLSEQYKCSVCQGSTCPQCHMYKEPGVEHQCNPDDVASVELLRRDSKRCPSCSTWIHRVEGCSQMVILQNETHLSHLPQFFLTLLLCAVLYEPVVPHPVRLPHAAHSRRARPRPQPPLHRMAGAATHERHRGSTRNGRHPLWRYATTQKSATSQPQTNHTIPQPHTHLPQACHMFTSSTGPLSITTTTSMGWRRGSRSGT